MKRVRAFSVLLVLLFAGLTGCFGKDEGPQLESATVDLIDDAQATRIEELAAPVPKSYVFPGQETLQPLLLFLNGTVSTAANLAYEDRNDRGGNSYNTVREVFDLRPHVPVDQPVELRMTLYWGATAGESADLDIYVDVPGTRTDRATDNNDEYNWKFSVQRAVVNTIARQGEPFEVGVQMANGRSSSEWSYTLRVEVSFPKDVIAPAVPWAFTLPREASGIVLSSEKAGGDEHVRAKVLVVDSDDNLVHALHYDDLSIPTESAFLPLAGGREYVLYAPEMTGGFLRLAADVGVLEREVRALPLARERVVVSSATTAGAGERDWLHDGTLVTPATGGQVSSWAPAAGFPVAIEPFIGNEDGAATVPWGEIRIQSGKGPVAWLQRVLRHDDERGSIGYTSDGWNSGFRPENLTSSQYEVWVADTSPGTEVGFVVTRLVRE